VPSAAIESGATYRHPVLLYVFIGIVVGAVVLALAMAGGTDPPKDRPQGTERERVVDGFASFCAQSIAHEKGDRKAPPSGLSGQPSYRDTKIDHWIQIVSGGDTRTLLHVGKTLEPSTEIRRVDLIGCFLPGTPEGTLLQCSYADPDNKPLGNEPTPTFQVNLKREVGTLIVHDARTGKELRRDRIAAKVSACPAESDASKAAPVAPLDQADAWNVWGLTHLLGGKLR
jgi:hypothetical protein